MPDYMNSKAIPVYLFIKAGKTQFIQEIRVNPKFCVNEK